MLIGTVSFVAVVKAFAAVDNTYCSRSDTLAPRENRINVFKEDKTRFHCVQKKSSSNTHPRKAITLD